MMNGNQALDALFWRDEILQIAYWFQGEGFGEVLEAGDLGRFLSDNAPGLEPYLDGMVQDGLLEQIGPRRYVLTDLGHKEGARRFADAFDELTHPAHGECSADCVCHTTGDPSDCPTRQKDYVHLGDYG